jgi:hypothetical protein
LFLNQRNYCEETNENDNEPESLDENSDEIEIDEDQFNEELAYPNYDCNQSAIKRISHEEIDEMNNLFSMRPITSKKR